MRNAGFTLVELLIVVSIITVLSIAGVTIYSSVLNNGRDQVRQRDLSAIRQALELYRGDQKYYPTSLPFGSILQSPNGAVYLQTVPQDALTGQSYAYQAYGDVVGGASCNNTTVFCKAFALCAKMQGTGSPACPVANLNCGTGIRCDMGVSSY